MKLSESITLDKRTIGNTCKSGSAFKVFGEGETPNPLARVQDLLRISRLKKKTYMYAGSRHLKVLMLS